MRKETTGDAKSPPTVVAIAARTPDAVSQTFVRRHINLLNGGQNVVVSNKRYPPDTFSKPTINYSRSRLAGFARAFLPDAGKHSTLLSPGKNRLLHPFLMQHGVTHVLLEFGYIATDIGPEMLATGLPVYCMFRGNDASSRLNQTIYRRQLRKVFPHLSGVISVSSHLVDNLARHGLTHPRTLIAPSGADIERFKPGKPENGRCICVGRFVPKKSPVPLLKAFARVAQTHDLTLELIGDGELQPKAEALAKSLGIADRVIFTGRLPHDEIMQRMRSSMLYIQHFQTTTNGDTEGMPGVIAEAMACGLPIVTTRHAGIPDHVEDGVNGRLTEPGDIEGMAQAIAVLSGDSLLRANLGAAARQYAVRELDYRISHSRIEAFMGLRANST